MCELPHPLPICISQMTQNKLSQDLLKTNITLKAKMKLLFYYF